MLVLMLVPEVCPEKIYTLGRTGTNVLYSTVLYRLHPVTSTPRRSRALTCEQTSRELPRMFLLMFNTERSHQSRAGTRQFFAAQDIPHPPVVSAKNIIEKEPGGGASARSPFAFGLFQGKAKQDHEHHLMLVWHLPRKMLQHLSCNVSLEERDANLRAQKKKTQAQGETQIRSACTENASPSPDRNENTTPLCPQTKKKEEKSVQLCLSFVLPHPPCSRESVPRPGPDREASLLKSRIACMMRANFD